MKLSTKRIFLASSLLLSIALSLINSGIEIPGIGNKGGGVVHAQGTNTPQPPDCIKFFAFTLNGSGAQTGAVQDNRSVGCVTWTLVYQATGVGSLAGVTFQSAPGASTAGTWVTYAGSVRMGSSNPMTSNTGGIAYFDNANVTTPWLRVVVTEGSFTGVLNGVYYGYKTGYEGTGATGGGGGGGGCDDPCVVIGPDAPGAAPTQDPVQTSIFDGTNVVRTPGTATGVYVQGVTPAGQLVPSDQNPVMFGVSSLGGRGRFLFAPNAINVAGDTGNQSFAAVQQNYNGATWDQAFVCNSQAAITITAAMRVVIVPAGGGSTIARICHVSFAQDNTANVQFVTGTGTTCQTGTANLSGAYNGVLGMALDFTEAAALRGAANSDICLVFSGNVTAGGVVKYATF